MKVLHPLLLLALLAGCVEQVPLAQYRPVVDPAARASRHYERDLVACRQLALGVEADYRKRQQDEMAMNLAVGLLAGAAVGAVAGSNMSNQGDYIATGAAVGALSGAAHAEMTDELVKYGPRRIVDRCMTERGHAVLNDPGRA